jgi:transposase
MNSLILTPSERKQLGSFIRHASSGRECCRAQALLWLDQEESVDEVANRLQVTRQTLYNWVQRFQEREGMELDARLSDGDRSGRPPSALGIIDPIIDAIIDQDPRQFGYRSTVWTAPLLQYHLYEEHDITVSRKSVSRALTRLRIRWKRPRHVLSQQSATWRQAKGG